MPVRVNFREKVPFGATRPMTHVPFESRGIDTALDGT